MRHASRRMSRHAVEHRFRRQDSTAGPGRMPAQHSVATLPLSFALRNAEVIQLGANIPPPARHSEIFGKHMKGLIFFRGDGFRRLTVAMADFLHGDAANPCISVLSRERALKRVCSHGAGR